MLLLLLLSLLTLSEGLDKERALRLRHKLLGNYSRTVQPSSSDDGGDDRLSVTLGFWPMAIVELDESKQVFTSAGSLVMRWLDPDLAWYESEFSDIGKLILLVDDVWLPQYTILNHVERISSRSLFSRVTVLNNGTVTYEITDVFKTICAVDLTRYPFDQQDCALKFSTLTAKYVFVEQWPFTLEITGYGFFTETKEWVLTELYSFTKTSYGINNVEYHFKVRRYPQFYVTTIIFPVALLSVLNSFVFLFPVESGENMSYLVSIMLSYAVYLNLINDVMPHSEETSRLAIYLVLALSQSALSIVMSLFTLNVHRHGKLPSNSPSSTPSSTFSSSSNNKVQNVSPDSFNVKGVDAATEQIGGVDVGDDVSYYVSRSSGRQFPIRKLNMILFGVFLSSALLGVLIFFI